MSANADMADALIPEPEDARQVGLRPAVLVGTAVIILFFGVFVGWAALAPLDSAAIAPGVLTVDTRRKTVQHLEGGIVSEILVREGDTVEANQVLIRLDDVQARARLEQLTDAYNATGALAARLAAERDGENAVTFPGALLNLADSDKIVAILGSQLDVFAARNRAQQGQVAILTQQIAQSRQEINGLRGQIAAEEQQITYLAEEITDTATLLDKGLVPKPRLLALMRRDAEIAGSRARNFAAIARLGKSIGESEIRIAELQTARINEAVEQLQDVDNRLRELAEEIRTAEDVYRRTKIRAPISGAVVSLRVYTTGGVLSPGERLMDIVPTDERLLVDARFSPNDIDVIAPGLMARVQLTALQQRNAQPLEGKLISVSADSLADERTGEPYYLGRIELLPAESSDTPDLSPGMQAQVFITSGRSTLLEYLLKPVVRTVKSGFREE